METGRALTGEQLAPWHTPLAGNKDGALRTRQSFDETLRVGQRFAFHIEQCFPRREIQACALQALLQPQYLRQAANALARSAEHFQINSPQREAQLSADGFRRRLAACARASGKD